MGLLSKLISIRDRSDSPVEYCVPKTTYGAQLCDDITALNNFLLTVNGTGWRIVSVTQDPHGKYTVVFSRFIYR